MRTIITNLQFFNKADLSNIEQLDKTDKIVLLYSKNESIPIETYNALMNLKTKPIMVESPDIESEENRVGLQLFRLGTLLADYSGTVVFLSSDDTIRSLDGFTYAKSKEMVNIRVLDSFKSVLKMTDKPVQKRARKTTTTLPLSDDKSEKDTKDIPDNKLVSDFKRIVKYDCSDIAEIDQYLPQILVALQEATEIIGFEVRLCVNINKEIGPVICNKLAKDYEVLRKIANKIQL